MLVTELEKAARESRSIDEVKVLIRQLNALSPTSKDLQALQKLAIFPTRLKSGEIKLRSKKTPFAIPDRDKLGFDGLIDFLDFSLEEVRKLRPFLSCFDFLNERYLSKSVKETSLFAFIARPSEKWTAHFRRRAHSLCRYVVMVFQNQ
jgi:hypothetical protein